MKRCIKYIDEQISDEKNKDTLNMLESGKEFFSKYLDGSASEGWVTLQPGTPIQNVKVIYPFSKGDC